MSSLRYYPDPDPIKLLVVWGENVTPENLEHQSLSDDKQIRVVLVPNVLGPKFLAKNPKFLLVLVQFQF